MQEEELILQEQDRAKLDSIVFKMEDNKESEEDIKFVVQDFKSKYGKPPTSSIEPVKKKDGPEISSDSVSGSGGSNSVSVSQELNIPEVDTDPETRLLYEKYMNSGGLDDVQFKDISDKLTKQKKGDRSFWETTKAMAKGFLETGIGIPIYNFNTQEELVAKKEMKNKMEFIEDLNPQEQAKLAELIKKQGSHLNIKTGNIQFKNNILEYKAKEIAKEMDQYPTLSKEEILALPQEEKQALQDRFQELKSIQLQYNDNFDVIESGTEDVGTFAQELDLLKRNYNGLDNFIGKAVDATKHLVAGMMEASNTLREVQSPGMVPEEQKEQVTRQAQGLRRQANENSEGLRPSISVNDIESGEDFGEWAADQIATQLPIITTLVATGGTTGSVLLGASSGGQKSLEMKGTNASGDTNYTNTEIFLASAGNGTLEFLSERVTGGILSKGKRTLQAVGKESFKKGVKKGLKNLVQDTEEEAFSEGISQMGQNMIDRYYLDNKNVGIFDGVEDAIASGGFMGAGMSMVPSVIGAGLAPFQSKNNNGTIRQNVQKLKDIQDQLNNPDIDPDIAKELEGLGKSIIKKNAKIIKDDIKNIENKSAEDLKKVSKINKSIDKLEKKAAKIVDNPDISTDVREDLSARMLKKLQDKKAQKEVIMDPKNKSNIQATEPIAAGAIKDSGADNSGSYDLKTELTNLGVDQKILDAISDKVTLDYKDLTKKENKLTNEGVGGFYEYFYGSPHKSQQIVMEQAFKDTPYGKESLIHEAVHAATVFTLGKITEDIGTHSSLEGFSKEQILAAKSLKSISDMYKDFTTVPLNGGLYGFNNVKEFVSEFIANPKFKDFIARTPTGKAINKKTLLYDSLVKNPVQTIWRNILKLLGLNPMGKGAKRITEIQDNIDKVLEAQKQVQQKVKDGDFRTGSDGKRITYVYTQAKPDQKTKKASKEYMKLFTGLPIISYIDEKVFENMIAKPVEKAVTRAVKKGLDSKKKLIRNIAEGYVSWFNGVARTDQEVANKRSLVGKQEGAYVRGSQLTKQLQELVGYSVESAQNVHKVMDPELYPDESVTYDQLNDSEKMLHDMLREINNATHELNYEQGFIDEETYNKFKGNYIGRGYEVFEDILQEEKGEFIKNKLGLDIYKHRKEVDQWKIDNKVQDPIYLTINRMIQTERNVAVKNYAQGIADSGVAKDEPQKGYTQLNSKTYGPLNGKYVPNYIAEDFKGYFFSNGIMDGLYAASQAYDKTVARQFLKRYHTVYNPVVQVGNLLSNHAFAFSAGVNIVQLWGSLPAAKKSIKSKDADYMTLLENGIIGANVLTPDLSLTDEAQKKLKLGKKGIWNKIDQMDKWSRKVYAGSDDIMKLAAYKGLRATGFTEDQAVQRVFEGFQNYATVGKIWDLASKAPVVGNAYIKFQADLMRIIKNSVTKRPLTTAAFLSSLKLATIIASMVAGESEEEKAIREARPFIPKIKGIPVLGDIPLVARIDNKEINMARFISPYYDYDIPNEDWLERLSEFTPIELRSKEEGGYRIGTPDVLLGGVWSAFITDKDFRNQSVGDPLSNKFVSSGTTEQEKLWNKFVYSARSTVPLVAPLHDAYLSDTYGEDYYGRSKDLSDLFWSKLVKVQGWDDEELKKTIKKSINSIDYKQKDIKKSLKGISNRFERDVIELGKKLEEGKITQDNFNNRVKDLEEKSLKRYNKGMDKLIEQQEKMNQLINRIHKLDVIDN